MKHAIVSALGLAEASLFGSKLWSLGTQVQKLKNYVAGLVRFSPRQGTLRS